MRKNEATPADLETAFRDSRGLLWSLCYRMTGVAADADEILQETFTRALERPPPDGPLPWQPWLVRVATNLSLDLLRARKRRSGTGAWLPSPVETPDPEEAREPSAEPGPEGRYELLEDVSFAYLLALETLSPRARAALLLRDVLDYSVEEAAGVLETSHANLRIIHHRARRALEASGASPGPPSKSARREARRAIERFMSCLVRQDLPGLEALLAESVRTVADGGGEFNALRRPITGRARVAVFHLRTARRRMLRSRFEIRWANGMPAVVIETANPSRRQGPRVVLRCELDRDGRIREIHSVLARRKLTAVRFGLL